MTKEQLGRYRDVLKEIPKVERDIRRLKDKRDRMTAVGDVVQASLHDYPYTVTRVRVEGVDHLKGETIARLLRKKSALVERLNEERLEVEDFIGSIEESRARQIFDAVFIKGRTRRAVAVSMGLSEGRITQIIDAELEKSKKNAGG